MRKKETKNIFKGKCSKKIMQVKTQRKIIHAQDGPHFDIKPEL